MTIIKYKGEKVVFDDGVNLGMRLKEVENMIKSIQSNPHGVNVDAATFLMLNILRDVILHLEKKKDG